MRITLTYRGQLPPTQRGVGSVKTKLRNAFHPQIKSQVERFLSQEERKQAMVTKIGGHEFVSPIHERLRTAAELDIMIFTGNGYRSGDSDNRLKTLIDGLTRPANSQQLNDFVEPSDGGPTFCLLDDDNLVERVNLDNRIWHEPNLDRNEALVIVSAKLVLNQRANMNTPMTTLFLLVS